MRKLGLLETSALRSTIVVGLSLTVAAPAYGQAAQAQAAQAEVSANLAQAQTGPETEQATAAGESIIVTGSRIRRPNLDSAVPITTVDGEYIVETGNILVGEQMNQLPQFRASSTQGNQQNNFAVTGTNNLDLRGLGSQRTLVLINGRRHVSTFTNFFVWDVNNVPADLIERVDVVTGGNSAVYGSDALAGVVNFVLRRSFEGIQLRGQAGLSPEGHSPSYFVAGTIGRNFAGGRGNVALAAEYSKNEATYYRERPVFREVRTILNVQRVGSISNPAFGVPRPAEPTAGDGIPDRLLFDNVRFMDTSAGGTFTASCPTAAFAGNTTIPAESAAAFTARRAAACSGLVNPGDSNPLAQFGTIYAFLPNGTLVPNNCLQDFRQFGSTTQCVGGLGVTSREQQALNPELNRVTATLVARYEVSPALQPFLEASYTRIHSVQQRNNLNQDFSVNVANNPFLSNQARALLQSTLAPNATNVSVRKRLIDFGFRGEDTKRQDFRIVGGIEGAFNGDWRYEVSANYGRNEINTLGLGEYDRTKLGRAAASAVRNSSGQIVCAVNGNASTADDDPACVPLNPFGNGSTSPEALNYIIYKGARRDFKNEQIVLNAFVSGDSSDIFELPGGPISFALGGEYREERQKGISDPYTKADPLIACPEAGGNCTSFLRTADFTPPTYKISDAFAELRLPLLADRPFFHELSLEAAGRASHYNVTGTGTALAYNAGLIWAPVPDIKLRASYGRAVRAPNPSAIYDAGSTSSVQGLADPCSVNNIPLNANRAKNCAAAGVPTTQTFTLNGDTFTEQFTNVSSSTLTINQGNADAREEVSDSFTVGAVFQPRFIPGLALSVDYYSIKIKDALVSQNGAAVLNACYDDPNGIDNIFCKNVRRLANGTFAGQQNVVTGRGPVVLNNPGEAVVNQTYNFAKTVTSGIDADLSYRKNLGGVTLNTRALVSYLIDRRQFNNASDPTFFSRQKSTLGNPQWRAQLSTNLDFGKFNIGHTLQYVGRQLNGFSYETFFPVQDRLPTNPDVTPSPWYRAAMYHDFRLEFDPTDRFQFYVGMNNAFNKDPYEDINGSEISNYDVLGRFVYAGAKVKF